MSHLTSDELVDALDRALPPGRLAHVASCDRCRRELGELEALLHDTRAVDVPEPSPLFWERLSDRVRTAIAAEGSAPPRLTRWFQWPVLAPLGALALLVVALGTALPHVPGRTPPAWEGSAAADTSEPAAVVAFDAETPWDVVAALVGDLDADTAREAGIAAWPGSAERVAAQLTAAEQEELLRLLRAELQESGG